MAVLKVLVFALAVTIAWAEESLLQPCSVKDIECLRSSTKMFMEKTAAGLPDYGVKPIDPYFTSLICVSWPGNVMLHYHNVTLKGLKNMYTEELDLNKETKKVMLKTKQDVDITADLVVELQDEKKSFSGLYNGKASTEQITHYNYSIITDDKGEHYDVGPETITVEVLSDPVVILSKELEEALANDPDVAKHDKSQLNEMRKKFVADVVKAGLHDVVHNIRAAAKVLPRNSFFTDV